MSISPPLPHAFWLRLQRQDMQDLKEALTEALNARPIDQETDKRLAWHTLILTLVHVLKDANQ